MASMNISLPDKMKEWVEAQAESGQYSNSSDYVRDLIRHDQRRAEKLKALRSHLAESERQLDNGQRIEGEAFFENILGNLKAT